MEENQQNQAVPNQEQSPEQPSQINESSVNKDIARLDVMNEEYNSMADKLRDEFNSTLSANPSTLFSEEELETLASDSDIVSELLGHSHTSMTLSRYSKGYTVTQLKAVIELLEAV